MEAIFLRSGSEGYLDALESKGKAQIQKHAFASTTFSSLFVLLFSAGAACSVFQVQSCCLIFLLKKTLAPESLVFFVLM